jgi:subtilisin family serine protease
MRTIRFFVSAMILFLIINGAIIAQTVNPLCVDGRVYFKINDYVSLNVASEDGQINPKDVYFLQDLVQKYDITTLQMPFLSAESDVLQRTFRMDFDNWYMIDQLIKDMDELADIEYIEEAPLFFISSVPNDPYYGEVSGGGIFGSTADANWHLSLINAEAAWDITTGDPNIVVAVLDNAIYVDHPDLQGKVVTQVDLGNGDDDPNPPEATYIWSHGTHSAGLVGAATNNGLGVASIGYNISIMAVKLGDDASDGQSMAAGFEGIVWAADNGADVISMSWGSPQFFQTMQNTVNYAYNKGCVLVGAAGNNGNGLETQMNPDIPINYVGYPAALEHVIAVGSCDVGDNKSDFSNYGTWIDVLAPGGYYSTGFGGIGGFSVLSTTASEAGDLMSVLSGTGGGAANYGVEGQYDVMQGTSMACPVTAGLCGLILSANPDLTPEELTAILKNTCDDVDAENTAFIDSIGAGRINAAAAVLAAQNAIAPLVADFEADMVVIPVDGSVNFTDLTTGTPSEWSWQFEGGIPSVSTEQNPSEITYSEEGVYQVRLTASNGTDSDTEIKTHYIIVGAGNGGAESAWLEQHTHFASQFRGVWTMDIVDENTAWILTYDGTGGSITRDFARTSDAGNTWIPDTIDVAENYAPGDISAADANNAWVAVYDVSGGGGIYNTTDGGQSWTHQATAAFDGTSSFCNVIEMFNETEGYTMGDPNGGEFEIYTTTDGGTNWILLDGANIPNPESNEMGWTGVKAAVGNTAWFGTNTGRIFRSQDKGQTWEAFSTGEANVSRITFWDENNGVIICQVTNQTTGQIESWSMRKTADGGETWSPINIAEENQLSDVSAVPGTLGMLVGIKISQDLGANFSAVSMDYGTSWEMLDDSVQYTCVQMFDESTGWAGSFNLSDQVGGMYKWIGASDVMYFSSSPVTEVDELASYSYAVTVVEPDALDVTISGITVPDWLTFTDNTDGTATLVGTAPAVTTPVETFDVVIEANNGTETIQQSFTINVNTINQAPEFTSTPSLDHGVDILYEYDVTATDPDDDELVITAETLPSWATFVDNGDGTGYLSGTPTSTSVLGFHVVLSVSDGMYEVEQDFRIQVLDVAPYFTSTPVESHVTDVLYEYNITAEDPNDDAITITATVLPDWASITDNGDGTAYLSGTPTEVNLTGYAVELTVSDGENEGVQNFLIMVEQNSIADFGMGQLLVYPNPVTEYFNVTNASGLRYRMYNLLGECVLEGTCSNSIERIGMQGLPESEYILQIYDNEQVVSVKVNKIN